MYKEVSSLSRGLKIARLCMRNVSGRVYTLLGLNSGRVVSIEVNKTRKQFSSCLPRSAARSQAITLFQIELLSSLLIHIRLVPIVIGCLFRITKKLRVIIDNRDLKYRQRSARRRRSQPKEDWVEGFVLGGKKES